MCSVADYLQHVPSTPCGIVLQAGRKRKNVHHAECRLASGNAYGQDVTIGFPSDDHRAFNRHGERSTSARRFSGSYDIALKACRRTARPCYGGRLHGQLALRWILMEDRLFIIQAVKNAAKRASNVSAARLAPLSDEAMQRRSVEV